MPSSTQQALEEWSKILPPDAVLTGSSLTGYQQNCLSLTRDIAAALRPGSEEDVIRVVRIANRHRVPLYTISTGHNWGYGSALPVGDGCVILDLSRMNRILDMDSELGLVTIEPGVTQKQLFDYLDAHDLNFFVPTTGAGPTASIVGNALERGFGMTPDEDHFRAVTSIRAVLPSGAVYRSYMSEFGAAGGVWKWGIGPYLDGLFAQGNFGVVTSMQISLVERPEHIEVYLFTLKKASEFSKLADGCRRLLTDLRGHIGGIKLLNQRQVELTAGTRNLGMNLAADFAWMGFGVIRCKRSMIRSLRREIGRELRPMVSRLVFINQRRLKLMRMAQAFMPGKKLLKEQLDRMDHLLDIVNGIPRGLELKLVYRHVPVPETPPLDPARDGVGIIWYAPVLPMKTGLILQMIDMIEKTLEKHGFEQAVSLTTIHEKCAIGVIPIIYRRPEEQQKAHECFRDLWRQGNELGCHPYRMNVGEMTSMTGGQESTFWNLARDLKAAIDPQNILSPGRYSPLTADPAEAD
jgi:4-cresol dehydrogenase (hydroxylating)